jgi:hypothetical protein
MLRAIALSLIFFLSLGIIVPLTIENSEAGSKSYAKKKKKKKIKKYSKKWWRIYRAKLRKKRALEARKRALKLRREKLARARKAGKKSFRAKFQKNAAKTVVAKDDVEETGDKSAKSAVKSAAAKAKSKARVAAGEDEQQSFLLEGEPAPTGWKKNKTASKSDENYKVSDGNGRELGSASLSVVGPAMSDDSGSRARSVGGVSTSALRRTVIDRMIKEEGWVVNDYQKEIGGKKVFVVVAQAPGPGNQVVSRIFYFTEVNGRIMSLSTNAPADLSERIAQDSERIINSLHRKGRPAQATAR